MDIVLELVDTFIADHVYAHLFPIKSNLNGLTNETVPNHQLSSWKWQPATGNQIFPLRTNAGCVHELIVNHIDLYRQLITLFFISW